MFGVSKYNFANVRFGWLGFNGGSSLAANSRGATANIASHLAACLGGLVWILLDKIRLKKPFNSIGFCAGAVCGLATVTPGCGYIVPWASLIFGAVGAIVSHTTLTALSKSKYYDDALDVFGKFYHDGNQSAY